MLHISRITTIPVLAFLILLAACSNGQSTIAASGTQTPSSTSVPTTPPKSKPTSVPPITMAFCQQILTIAEANQIMNPSTPATTIRMTPHRLAVLVTMNMPNLWPSSSSLFFPTKEAHSPRLQARLRIYQAYRRPLNRSAALVTKHYLPLALLPPRTTKQITSMSSMEESYLCVATAWLEQYPTPPCSATSSRSRNSSSPASEISRSFLGHPDHIIPGV